MRAGLQEEDLRFEFNALSDGSPAMASPVHSTKSYNSIQMSALRTKSSRRASAYSKDQVKQLIELFPEISHLKQRATEDNLQDLFSEALEELVEILGTTKNVEKELFRRKEAQVLVSKKAAERDAKKTAGVRFAADQDDVFRSLETEALHRAGIAEQALANASAARDKVSKLYQGLLSTTVPVQCDPNKTLLDEESTSSVEKITQELAPYPNNSAVTPQRWGALRAEARVIITRRLLVGWKMMAQYCKGKECRECPLLIKQKKIQCVVCGGTGAGMDGIYANKGQAQNIPSTEPTSPRKKNSNDQKPPIPLNNNQKTRLNTQRTMNTQQVNSRSLMDRVLSPVSEDTDDTPSNILGALGNQLTEHQQENYRPRYASDKENTQEPIMMGEYSDEDGPPDEFDNLLRETRREQNKKNSVIVYDLADASSNANEVEVQDSTEGAESYTSMTSNRDYYADESGYRTQENENPSESQETTTSNLSGEPGDVSTEEAPSDFSENPGVVEHPRSLQSSTAQNSASEQISEEKESYSQETQEWSINEQSAKQQSSLQEHSSSDAEQKQEVLDEANSIISKSGITVKRMRVGKAILQKTEEGWSLIDASCEICDMPLLIDPEGEEELCVFCEVNGAEVKIRRDRATPSEITDVIYEKSRPARVPPPESITVVQQSTGSSPHSNGHGWNGTPFSRETSIQDQDVRMRAVASPDFDERGMFPFLEEKNPVLGNANHHDEIQKNIARTPEGRGLGIQPREMNEYIPQSQLGLHPSYFEALHYVTGKQSHPKSPHHASMPHIRSPQQSSFPHNMPRGNSSHPWHGPTSPLYHVERRQTPPYHSADTGKRDQPAPNIDGLHEQCKAESSYEDTRDYMKARVTENIRAGRINSYNKQNEKYKASPYGDQPQRVPYTYRTNPIMPHHDLARPWPQAGFHPPTFTDETQESSNVYSQEAPGSHYMPWQQNNNFRYPASIFSRQHNDELSDYQLGVQPVHHESQSRVLPTPVNKRIVTSSSRNVPAAQGNRTKVVAPSRTMLSEDQMVETVKEDCNEKAMEEMVQSRAHPLIDDTSTASTKNEKSLTLCTALFSDGLIPSIRPSEGATVSGHNLRTDPPDIHLEDIQYGSRDPEEIRRPASLRCEKSPKESDQHKVDLATFKVEANKEGGYSIVIPEGFDFNDEQKVRKLVLLATERNRSEVHCLSRHGALPDPNQHSSHSQKQDGLSGTAPPNHEQSEQNRSTFSHASLIDCIKSPARHKTTEHKRDIRSDPPTGNDFQDRLEEIRGARDPDDDFHSHLKGSWSKSTDPSSPPLNEQRDQEEAFTLSTEHPSEGDQDYSENSNANEADPSVKNRNRKKGPSPESPTLVGDLSSETRSSRSRNSRRRASTGTPQGPSDEESGTAAVLAPRVQSPYFADVGGHLFSTGGVSRDSRRHRTSRRSSSYRAPSVGENEAYPKVFASPDIPSHREQRSRKSDSFVANRSNGSSKTRQTGSRPPLGGRKSERRDEAMDCSSTFSSWSSSHSSGTKEKSHMSEPETSSTRRPRSSHRFESPNRSIGRTASSQSSWSTLDKEKPEKNNHKFDVRSRFPEKEMRASRRILPYGSRSMGSFSSWDSAKDKDKGKSRITKIRSTGSHNFSLKSKISEEEGDDEDDMFFVGGPLESTPTGALSPNSVSSDATPFEYILNRCKEKMGQLSFSDESEKRSSHPNRNTSFTTGKSLHINLVDHEDANTTQSARTGKSSVRSKSSGTTNRSAY